jgi:hypothetical protein
VVYGNRVVFLIALFVPDVFDPRHIPLIDVFDRQDNTLNNQVFVQESCIIMNELPGL